MRYFKDNPEEITKAIAHIGVSAGYTAPDAAEMMILRTNFIKVIGDLDIEIFYEAVEAYIEGRLQVKKDFQLSSKFISAIVREYKEIRGMKQFLDGQKALPEPEIDKTSRRAQDYQFIQDYCYRKKELPKAAPWISAYGHAYHSKNVRISEKQRHEYIEKATKIHEKERVTLQSTSERRKFEADKDIERLCKELFMKDYFNNLILNEL